MVSKIQRQVAEIPKLKNTLEGWYSPGIRVGNMVFLCGLIGKDHATGLILEGTEKQVQRIFEDMTTILQAHDASLSDVVQMTMYFTDRKRQWPIFDRIRREFFPKNPPCTAGIGIAELEQGADIEIQAIAAVA